MTTSIPIHELDTIYLSYHEPQREEFWHKIKNEIHWAKRVDGVHGSDAAHKAAAQISETERFILIDGDNIPDFSFWDEELLLDDNNRQAQFRWRAKNNINGLYYGNGGLSCWTREFVYNMKTHENSVGDSSTDIEFCFHKLYWPMHDCFSITYPNYSPKQAWRAGFREGVKLCTRSGVPPPKEISFIDYVWPKNLQNLIFWQTIGRDVENGFWAILGARLGTYYLMLKDWDYKTVQDFNELDKIWEHHKHDDEKVCSSIGTELRKYLRIPIVEFDGIQSEFVKNNLIPKWKNKGIMERETY